MALPLSNTFETGLADETGLTVANSNDGVAGNAFDAVTIGGTGTIVFDSLRAAHGTLSARFDPEAEQVAYVEWSTSHGPLTDVYGRLYIYRTAHPAEPLWLVMPRNTVASLCALVQWRSDAFYIFDAPLSNFANTTAAPSLNEWMRLEWHLVCHATLGSIELKTFHGDDISSIETISLTNVNTQSDVASWALGSAEVGQTVGTFWLDDLIFVTTGYPGPPAPSSGIPSRSGGRIGKLALDGRWEL